MKNKEINNFDLIKNEYDKELQALRERIGQEVRDERRKKIKGTATENEAAANWALNSFPVTPLEKEKMVADQRAVQDRKEEKIQQEIEARLKIDQKTLERAHFGGGGITGAKAKEEREAKIQDFKTRTRKKDALKKQALAQKREVQNTAKKVMKLQNETRSHEQDNRAYRPKGNERIKAEFKDKAERTKTLSMEFEAQNEKVKNLMMQKAALEAQQKQRAKHKKAVAFKKEQQQKGKTLITKQKTSIPATQNNDPIKTIDAGTDFNHSSGAKNKREEGEDKNVDRDRAAEAFKAKIRARDKDKSIRHEHTKGHRR